MNKLFLKAITVFLFFFAAIWIFNHVDPWIGLLTGIIGIYTTIKLIK